MPPDEKAFMADDYLSAARARAARRRSGTNRAIYAVALGAFAFGAIAAGAVAWQFGAFDRTGASTAQTPAMARARIAEESPQPTPTATETTEATAREVENVVRQTGGLDSRLAALEQRINRLDLQAEAAAGNAARAEGLLIAFAARRAIDRGDELGYLSDQLNLRFGDAQPNAVQTVIDLSQDPVTLDRLVARLEGLQGDLVTPPGTEGLWSRLRREANELFVVRRQDTPSPQPARRVERARLFLESGRVQSAIAEVENLPGAPDAQDWLDDARRYAALHDALDRIESAAVLEPRRLRDGAGDPVQQLSPAQETP